MIHTITHASCNGTMKQTITLDSSNRFATYSTFPTAEEQLFSKVYIINIPFLTHLMLNCGKCSLTSTLPFAEVENGQRDDEWRSNSDDLVLLFVVYYYQKQKMSVPTVCTFSIFLILKLMGTFSPLKQRAFIILIERLKSECARFV